MVVRSFQTHYQGATSLLGANVFGIERSFVHDIRDLPTDNRLLYQLMYAAVVQVSKLV